MHCRFESLQTVWISIPIKTNLVVINQPTNWCSTTIQIQIKWSNMFYTFFPSPARMFAVPPSAKVSTVNVMLWKNS